MKKFIVAVVCLCFLGMSVLAQTSRVTRPRIVTSPTPTNPQEDSSTQDSIKRPPVLKGGTTSTSQTPNPTETPVEEDDEVIRIETNLVTLPVSVLDRDGRFITGLQKQDFRIFENGVEQKVESFASVEQPFTVVLMLDVSPSTQFKINEIQDAAIRGTVFVDSSHDGVRGAGERGLPGITVYLDLNNNGSLDAGEPQTVSSTDLFFA